MDYSSTNAWTAAGDDSHCSAQQPEKCLLAHELLHLLQFVVSDPAACSSSVEQYKDYCHQMQSMTIELESSKLRDFSREAVVTALTVTWLVC